MNEPNDAQHSEVVAAAVEWAKRMLSAHPNDGDYYWLTTEGQEVIAIAEREGLI